MKQDYKENIAALFSVYPVLKTADEKVNGGLLENVQFRSLRSGEKMSTVNGVCEGFIFVVQGKIKIHRLSEEGNETHLYYLEKGELCHEALSCLKHYEPLNIIGEAVQDCQIALLPMQTVREKLLSDNLFLNYMYEDLFQKFSRVIEGKEANRHDPLENRLMALLKSKGGKIIYTTHKELAMEIDASREAVSRKLKLMEKKGRLKLQRGKIILADQADV